MDTETVSRTLQGGDKMIDGINENQEYCYLRLPCGICRLTMTDCPKLNQLAYITTSTGTTSSCEVNIHTNNEVTE